MKDKIPMPLSKQPNNDELTVYEEVSLAVAQGRSEQLNERQRVVLERTKDAYRIICDLPNKRLAVNKLKKLYPDLSEAQLYRDINYAIRIWNPMNRMDKDFLTTVLLNGLVNEIRANGETHHQHPAQHQRQHHHRARRPVGENQGKQTHRRRLGSGDH